MKLFEKRYFKLLGVFAIVGILGLGSFLITGDAQAQVQERDPLIPLCEINRNLNLGTVGEDVRCLQRYLNHEGFLVAATGFGSPGQETTYFGPLTRAALIRWQGYHSLVPATGTWNTVSFNRYVNLVRTALGV